MNAVPHAVPSSGLDADDVRAGLSRLLEAGHVYELRVPKAGRFKTVSGYFDRLDALAEAAAEWDGRAPGVYVTLNAARPELLARAANRARPYADTTTGDAEVPHRTRLLVDLDPVRPSGIAATDAEHLAALARAQEIREALGDLGWPPMLVMDSGNGAYLVAALDVPSDDASKELVAGVLRGIASRFSDDVVQVDLGVYNAARIARVPGTLNAKGDATAERPHRRARIIDAPACWEPVPLVLLERVAGWAPADEPRRGASGGSGGAFDLNGFIARHGLTVLRDGPWSGGRRVQLAACPFDAAHTGGSAALFQFASGAVAFRCLHNGCAGRDWHDVRGLFEPQKRTHGGNGADQGATWGELHDQAPPEPEDLGEPAGAGHFDELVPPKADGPRSYLELAPTAAELAAMAAAPPIVPIATSLIYPRTTTVYAGQTNAGKTTSVARVGVDLVYGREPWTGRRDGRERRRMLLLSKDDTTRSLVWKVRALAPDADWMSRGDLVLIGKEKRPLALDDRGVEVLGNTVADGKFDVFVIDPYQHFLPAGLTVNDDEGARRTIDVLDRIAEQTGSAGVLIHHPRKRPPKAKSALEMTKAERLEEIRGSAVLAQLARAVATLWELEPGVRLLDAVVNDVPPLAELYFETSTAGDQGVRWELAGPPTNAEAEAIRDRLLDLEIGVYNVTALARHLFEISERSKPSGQRRTQAKAWARRFAEEQPQRFRVLAEGALEVLARDREVLL